MARIVFVNRYFHPDESATSRMLTDLARHLARAHEVHVVCGRQLLEDPAARLPRREAVGGVTVHRVPSTRFGRHFLPGRAIDYLTFLASVLAWLLRHARRGTILVAKTDPPLLAVAVGAAASVRGALLVNWWQDVYPELAWRLGVGAQGSPAGRLLRGLRNWALRHARVNVAISEGMAGFLEGAAGIARPLVIPNWSPDLAGDRRAFRDELGLADAFVVGYSGNLGRAHPVAPLLGLAEALRDERSVRFLVSGGGANMAPLRAAIESAGVRNWTFLPYQPRERLGDLLATADLHFTVLEPALEQLIVPSKLYGILAAGRPVLNIGDPAGEVAAVLGRHACGWTCRPDDIPGLAATVRRLAKDREEAAAAGRAARRAFVAEYAAGHAFSRWDSAISALVDADRDGAPQLG